MKSRKRKAMPQMILWDRRQQQRFVDAVEKLVGLVNDIETLLAPAKRRRAARIPPVDGTQTTGSAFDPKTA